MRFLEVVLLAFAFTSFLSIAAGNIFLGIATALFLFFAYRNKIKIEEGFKGYYIAYSVFLVTMLLSAFLSGDVFKGFKVWADLWIWRWMPFVIVTMMISEFASAKKILLSSVFGVSMGFITLIYQGLAGAHRAAGFFGHPMTFAGYFCVFLPVLLVCFFEKNILGKFRYVSGILFLLGCIALFYNGTRGAWLALAPVILFIGIYYMLQNKRYMVLGLVFLIASGCVLMNNDRFIKRISSVTNVTTDTSNTERLLMWESAFNMVKDNPVLGVGLGQYKDNYQKKYILPEAKQPYLSHAHSNYMQMLAENGILGFLGFIGFVGYILIKNIVDFFDRRCPFSLIIACSTTALMLQGVTEYNFGNSAVVKIFWLILGCILVMKNNRCSKCDRKE